ncbi:hypothetical protein [Rubripirellula reticaptiva]|nr:hypothetical protein [Rubripirellula reticaptiva]
MPNPEMRLVARISRQQVQLAGWFPVIVIGQRSVRCRNDEV